MWKSTDNKFNEDQINNCIEDLFSTVHTGAISVSTDTPWIFTAYLAYDKNSLWFTSQETTHHTSVIATSPNVAVSIWKSPINWGDPLFGLQLSGTASIISDEMDASAGLAALHKRFTGTQATLPDIESVIGEKKRTCLFRIIANEGYLRDEKNLGKGRHKVVWSR